MDQSRSWGRLLARAGVVAAVAAACLAADATSVRAAPEVVLDGGGTGPRSEPNAATMAPCPAGDFLADLPANPANAAHPPPSLSVACTDAQVTVRTNGIPTFPFVAKTPNPLRAQDFTFRFARMPVAATTPGALNLGAIGVAVDGLPIYGPFEAPTHGTADPAADGILDTCGGHAGPAGEYHVHATPACLPAGRMATPGAVVGYALDGYPIMSPLACADAACTTTRAMRSGWVQVSSDRNVWSRYAFQDGAGDLDRCNGMTGPDGQYRYYAVSTFPYFLGCYHGQAGATGSGARPGAGIGATPPSRPVATSPAPSRTLPSPPRAAPPPRPLAPPRPRR